MDYYDVRVQESSLGDLTEATKDDLDRYCQLAEEELEKEGYDAGFRVSLSADGDGYTFVGDDGQTWHGPLTEGMSAALGRAFERWIG